MEREHVLNALDRFTAQRPGLEFGNYCSGYGDREGRKAYFAESRSITRDRHDAERLLRAVALSAMPLETLLGGFRAYSGRLTVSERKKQHSAETCPGKPCATGCDHVESLGVALDYCTGQYFPTEYRRAVCAVLSASLWDYRREDSAASARKGESPGDAIRRNFAHEFGLRFARRWFDA